VQVKQDNLCLLLLITSALKAMPYKANASMLRIGVLGQIVVEFYSAIALALDTIQEPIKRS